MYNWAQVFIRTKHSRIEDTFSRIFSKFSQNPQVVQRLGKFVRTLKIHVEIYPLYYEDSLRLNVYDKKGKNFQNLKQELSILQLCLLIDPFTPRVRNGDIKVIRTVESVDEILWCGYSNETSSTVLSHGIIYILVFYKMKFGVCLEF